jgi:hypothetical protein
MLWVPCLSFVFRGVLAAENEFVATAGTIEKSGADDPCCIGGFVGAIFVAVGRAAAFVGTGVLHAMHRAIADGECLAGIVDVGEYGGTGCSRFVWWRDWCNSGAGSSVGRGCDGGRVGAMVSCFAGGDGGQFVHCSDGSDECCEDVFGVRFETPRLGFIAEMSVALKGGKDFVDDGGVGWFGAVFGGKGDDTVDCCPIFFNVFGRVVTSLQFGHLLGNFGGSDSAVGAVEMPH